MDGKFVKIQQLSTFLSDLKSVFVRKEEGKQLSDNNYTDEEKEKLAKIDQQYLKLTGGTVTGETTFLGKLTASGETSVPTPSTENNSKTIANTEFVHGVVSDLVNGAPDALDTLQELAGALGDDPNFATTILNKIGEKESKTDAQIEHEKLQNAIDALIKQPLQGNTVLWDHLHRFGSNPTLPTTNTELNKLGVFISYIFGKDKIANQPTQYGQLINLPADKNNELAQFWIEQYTGKMFYRGGNGSNPINDIPFKRFLNENDATALNAKIPTKVSQLTDDVGIAKISNGHLVINGSELWIE